MSRAALPERSTDPKAVLDAMESFREGDKDWRQGRTWSLVYHGGEAHERLLEQAHAKFASGNLLNPMAFRSLKRMEREVVERTLSLLNAPETGVGAVTSGGTESILLAVKAARDRLRQKRPWVRTPEIVMPHSAHVAFDKGAHYFGLRVRRVPLCDDKRVDVDAMRRAISGRTALLVASAPQYPHGVIDPIEEVSDLALRHGVPLHVDACIGGFSLPFLQRLGEPIPPFDFRLPGVTSMSADLHKYGLCAKGASVVLYRDLDLMKHSFFVATDWPGGVYVSPTVAGTRPGGPIAAAWAAMTALGMEGYLDHTRRALAATRALVKGLRAIPGIDLVAEPDATLVAWHSVDPAVATYALADLLEGRGWNLDRQKEPESVHLTVTSNHVPYVDEYVADVRAAVEHARAHPELRSQGQAAMYGMMAKMPARALVGRAAREVFARLYAPGGGEAFPAAGERGSGGPMGMLERYGDRILGALDGLEKVRAKLRRTRPAPPRRCDTARRRR
jgi:glutamate/tyrosine decarboxylase-like PLP-dependent enzyme